MSGLTRRHPRRTASKSRKQISPWPNGLTQIRLRRSSSWNSEGGIRSVVATMRYSPARFARWPMAPRRSGVSQLPAGIVTRQETSISLPDAGPSPDFLRKLYIF